jgi:ribosomal protein L29
MDMNLIQGTITSLKFAGDVAKSLLELKTLGDVQGKVIELQSAILSAQSSALSANAEQSAMVEEIRELKKEIAKVKAWETEKQRYKLTNPWSGGVAYALKETMANGEPPHLICTKCYEEGRKSILNPLKDANNFELFACPVCKSQIPTGYKGLGSKPEYASE